jgi:sugar phosphate isomerase/epimerase
MLSAIRLMPPLAATLAPLGEDPVAGLEVLRAIGYRAVQLSATQPGMRPRELDASSRRDLSVRLRRLEMRCAGLDLWIPPEHFANPVYADRALDAMKQAISLAADLGRVAVSTALPAQTEANAQLLRDIRAMISGAAAHAGVEIADHGSDAVKGAWEGSAGDPMGVGIDPAMLLSIGEDPVLSVARCAKRLRAARIVDMLQSGMRAPPCEADGARLQLDEYVLALAGGGFRRSPVADARNWHHPRAGLERVRALWPAESES